MSLNKDQLEVFLQSHPLIQPRLSTLKLAEQINPGLTKPHIVGGYLRNIALGLPPRDCDVLFQGQQMNQTGVLEAVQEAEKRLGIEPYPEWEFENTNANGFSGDFYSDAIGKTSHHTDYITMLLMDTQGKLYVGDSKTIDNLNQKIYDINFPAVEIWASHRGLGRSYTSCLVGDLIRGMYLCQTLDLNPSQIVVFLLENFDLFFRTLDDKDQQNRKDYWIKKTKNDPMYQNIIKKFGITSLA